ncbi:MAG: T9SS type A sorting domain-containing protein [Bacteroidales bacterium]|nr:T9SS type A sorting domain-containing protein [Bacteroidales bacterium]
MKKLLLIFVTLFMFSGFVSSQTVLYEDNLDTYALNSFLAVVNPTWWTTWSNQPGGGEDIQIKNTFSHTAPMSGSVDMVGGQADAILKLGNKVAGAYELTWFMYIETGKCGYYNIQHMQSPGIEWAFEVYFRTGGAIELLEGGNTINGSYNKDQWLEVKHEIDLDADEIKLYFDGVLFHTWAFSNEATAPGGTKQLGGVDFFAGAKSGTTESPAYFIDDIYYAETVSGAVPIITATPTSIYKWLLGGATGTETLTVNNTGLADLTFDVNIVYDIDGMKSAPANTETGNAFPVKRVLTKVQADPTPTAGGPAPVSDASAQLHYDGDNASAVGWNTPPVTVTVAARFPNAMTLPYAGLDLISVEVYVNNLNTAPASNLMKVRIYGMGNTYEPGAILYEQTFTPVGTSWNTITLTTPVKVTGEDLWVGYNFTQTTASIYIPGTDGGPADPNGDFLSTGVGWSHLSPGLDYNWNIRANLLGTVAAHWLTVAPMTGTVAPAATKPLTLSFATAGLTLGQYKATVKLLSNDTETPVLDVPVTLDVVGVGINEIEKTGVMIYPNPVTTRLNIVSNGTINNISITDINGKVIYNGMSQSIDFSRFSSGVYFVKVQTTNGTSNTKFVKN